MIAYHVGWAFTLALFLSALATPIVLRLARGWGLVDLPHARKVHSIPTPRIGGLAFAFATTLTVGAFWFFQLRHVTDPAHTRVTAAILVGGALLALVGLTDDIWGIPAKFKLLALILASVGFCAAGGAVDTVIINGLHIYDLGIAAWPLTILWIVVVSVAIAFIDGLDGLAAGIGLIASAVLFVSSFVSGDPTTALLAASVCGSLLGFLYFNYNPAKIFMGDSGSMFLGFVLATSTAGASGHIGTTRAMILPGLALSIPLFDLLFTMMRRGIMQRRSLFAAERGHIHHKLMDAGLCHLHAVLVLHLVTLCGAAVAMVCLYCGFITNTICVIAFCIGLTGLFRVAGSIHTRSLVAAIRRNRAIGRTSRRNQDAFYDLQLRFRQVQSFDGWWQQVCHAALVFNFAKLDLPITDRENRKTIKRWRRDGEPLAASSSLTAEIPIPQRRTGQTLRAQVEVAVDDSLESAGQRIALFSRLMGEYGLDQLRKTIPVAPKPAEPKESGVQPAAPSGPFKHLRVALVHDFLYTYAGAERVLEQLIRVFPHADLFSLFDFLPPEKRDFLQGKSVQPTFLQRMPFARQKHRAYLPLMPLAIEQLDVSEYDLVISSSYVAAKGVITRPDQLHICYCHTPVRFAWELQKQYLQTTHLMSGVGGVLAKVVLHYIRNWDVRSANGVDTFVCNSNFVKRRIQKIYRRNATTIYPPVDTAYFEVGDSKGDFYLAASRLVPYKRIDLVVSAFAKTPERKLIVVGEGPERARIEALAKGCDNIRIVGHQPQESLKRHMQQAKALVFAAEEDFGIIAVEAQACGTPVIAFGRGGSTETVIDDVTGIHFAEQKTECLITALDRFESKEWDSATIRAHAERFDTQKFNKRITDFVAAEWTKFKAAGSLPEVSVNGLGLQKTIWRDVPPAETPLPLGNAD